MLLQIRDYLRREKTANSQQMAREFSLDIQALQPMLAFWLQKGTIIQCNEQMACQNPCFKCTINPIHYYEYVGAK